MNTYHKSILESSLGAREKEVTEYQVNIDNYRLAIRRIGSMPAGDRVALEPFCEQLVGLLASSLLEQKKAAIMLDVVRQQLEGTPCDT